MTLKTLVFASDEENRFSARSIGALQPVPTPSDRSSRRPVRLAVLLLPTQGRGNSEKLQISTGGLKFRKMDVNLFFAG